MRSEKKRNINRRNDGVIVKNPEPPGAEEVAERCGLKYVTAPEEGGKTGGSNRSGEGGGVTQITAGSEKTQTVGGCPEVSTKQGYVDSASLQNKQ